MSGLRKKVVRAWRLEWPLIVCIGVMVLVAPLLIKYYRYQINPDGTSYISIAQKYAHLDLRHAINGYWGPLISWLLVPFVWLKINMIAAFKLVDFILGLLLMAVFYYGLSRVAKLPRRLSFLFCAGLVPILLVWIFQQPLTPDLLFVLVLLAETLYLARYLAVEKPSYWMALILGALGALLYYAKPLGFYLFIGQLVIVALLKVYLAKSWKGFRQLWQWVAVFFLVFTLPFVVALSFKYHKLTVSNSEVYNHGIVAPANMGLEIHPATVEGPFAPPNSTAFSAWEDPTFLPVSHWSVFSNFHYFLSLFNKNLNAERGFIATFGGVFSIGTVVLLAYALRRSQWPDQPLFLLGLSTVLLLLGYGLLIVEDRYLWFVVPAGLVALAYFCKNALKDIKIVYWVAGLLALGSIWFNVQQLYNGRYVGKNILESAEQLKPLLPAHATIVGDDFATIFVCYYNNWACYGVLTTGDAATNQATFNLVKKWGIHYFVDYGPGDMNPGMPAFLAKNAALYKTVHAVNYLDTSPTYPVKIYSFN